MKAHDAEFHRRLHSSMKSSAPEMIFRQRTALFPTIRKIVGDDISGARILDVAAGNGYASIYWAKRLPGVAVVAIEDSEVAALDLIPRFVAAHGVEKQVTSLRASFDDLPDMEPFDLVLCFGALHHSSNLDKTFKSLLSVMKPGGLLVAHEPVMPDKTTNRQYVDKYQSVEIKEGVRAANYLRDDHFYRRSEYIVAAAHAGLDLQTFVRISNEDLWLRRYAQERQWKQWVGGQLRRFANSATLMQRTPDYLRGLTSGLFVWSPSNVPWIPHTSDDVARNPL